MCVSIHECHFYFSADIGDVCVLFFFFSSRRRHTRCALVTGVQTCALPIWTTEPDPGRGIGLGAEITATLRRGIFLARLIHKAKLLPSLASLASRPTAATFAELLTKY